MGVDNIFILVDSFQRPNWEEKCGPAAGKAFFQFYLHPVSGEKPLETSTKITLIYFAPLLPYLQRHFRNCAEEQGHSVWCRYVLFQ